MSKILPNKETQDCRYNTPVPFSKEVLVLDERIKRKLDNKEIMTTFQCATSKERLTLERPNDPKLWLAKGLAQEEQMLFVDAIETYSEGLIHNPFSDTLYECRGHIYITVGRYKEAIADSILCVRINQWNWYGWYHIGLGYYFLGDFERAVEGFRKCLEFSYPENEHNVAAIDWMYISLKHLGKDGEAKEVLAMIHSSLDRARSTYEERLFIYKGLTNPKDLLESIENNEKHHFLYSIYGNAIALNYYFNGELNKAKELMEDVVSKDRYWQTFGYLSSQAELKRLFGQNQY
jgi:tetratricopeptide (TPR) repeat protein